MEDPGGTEFSDIGDGNLIQAAVSSSAVVAVVGSPILADRPGERVLGIYLRRDDGSNLPCGHQAEAELQS